MDMYHSELLTLLHDTLQLLPGANAVIIPSDGGAAGPLRMRAPAIRFTSGTVTVDILPILKRTVFPRDARELLWELQQRRDAGGAQAGSRVPLLAADAISVGAREMLRREGVAYFDSSGSLFLGAHGIYLFVERPPPKRIARISRSLFTGRRQQVVLSLLSHPGEWFNVVELAGLAEVSSATTSQTLLALSRYDWLETSGKGPAKRRRLTSPGALLDAWAEHRLTEHKPTKHEFAFLDSKDSRDRARRLAHAFSAENMKYAMTHVLAAECYMGLPPSPARLYFYLPGGERTEELLMKHGCTLANATADLIVYELAPDTPILFPGTVNGLTLTSPVQVYLDLLCTSEQRLAADFRRARINF